MSQNSLVVLSVDGFAKCKSVFGEYCCTLHNFSCEFKPGTTALIGEIDSGGWALCYVLSTCGKDNSIVLDSESKLIYDNTEYSFARFARKVGYLDKQYGLSFFERKQSVAQLITRNLLRSKSGISNEYICELFQLDKQRLNRQLSQCGNEYIRARAAIEFSGGKEVFCFPWLSSQQYIYYKKHVDLVCSVLERNSKIVILPTSTDFPCEGWSYIDMR